MLVIVFHGLEDHGQFATPAKSVDELTLKARALVEKLHLGSAVRYEVIASDVRDHHDQPAPYIEIRGDSKDECRKVKAALVGQILPVLGNCTPTYD